MPRPFTRVTLQVMGPLLAWLVCFTAVYVVGALACARGFAQVQVAGLHITGLLTTLLVLATAAFTVWKIITARKLLRRAGPEQAFSGFLAVSLGGLVLLGLLLVCLPVLVVRPTCTGQPELEVAASAAAAAGTMPAFPAGL